MFWKGETCWHTIKPTCENVYNQVNYAIIIVVTRRKVCFSDNLRCNSHHSQTRILHGSSDAQTDKQSIFKNVVEWYAINKVLIK